MRGFELHTRAYDGGLGFQQRNSLALHVGAHQGAVGVIVLKEGDHRGGDGHQLLGGYVNIVHALARDAQDLFTPAAGDMLADKAAIRV